MAGNYPDVPGHRMAYDRDGTVAVQISPEAAITTLSVAQLQAMNDEDSDSYTLNPGGNNRTWHLVFIFPELRDVVGYYAMAIGDAGQHPYAASLAWSANTTNGLDGTWTSLPNWTLDTTEARTRFRTEIKPLAVTGAKAVRFVHGNSLGSARYFRYFHLYGGPSTGENPHRLRVWHPTLDQEIGGAYLDWADIPRSSSGDRQFRIKNNSPDLTANTVTVSVGAPSDTTPSVSSQHLFEKASAPGFASSVVLPSLAPGAVSEIITLRRNQPADAILGLWWARLAAVAATWTTT